MQVLKDSVRQAIIESAVSEFFEKSYSEANMRDIAHSANITVGNIYRYYPNKKSLFNEILKPAEKAIKQLSEIDASDAPFSIDNKQDLDRLINRITSTINPYLKEIFIIIFNSHGTHHERLRNQLEELILIKVSKYHPGKFTRSFLEIISKSFVDSIFLVIKKNIHNNQKIETMIAELLVFYFKDLNTRML